MRLGMEKRACPCGSPSYDECCGPLHRGEAQAGSPEALMRSRYSAYAIGDVDYVWRTWHPRTRPERVTADPATTWTALEVLRADEDTVEFRAHFAGAGGPGVLHETSTRGVTSGPAFARPDVHAIFHRGKHVGMEHACEDQERLDDARPGTAEPVAVNHVDSAGAHRGHRAEDVPGGALGGRPRGARLAVGE